MSAPNRIRRALLSVHDKRGLGELARALANLGVELISTGGTAKAIADAGVPVTPVDAITRFPEMLDGRVKTLHPAVHGGILFRRDLPEHRSSVTTHGIGPIDLVCVNLYPFERTVARDGVTDDEAIEQIDIGGPSMVRSAAKNHAFVTVITAPEQYDELLSELRAHDGATSDAFRRNAAGAAFARTAAYDGAIAAWMAQREGTAFPATLVQTQQREMVLRYGENPHQSAAAYRDPSWRGPAVIGGASSGAKALSYNNLLDASASLEAVLDLAALDPRGVAACVVKHTNPCGAAIAANAREAFLAAWSGDPLAAYGGIVALSAVIDEVTADAIVEGDRFVEVIVAPSFSPAARDRLTARWKNVRLVEFGGTDGANATNEHAANAATQGPWSVRSIAGGWLVQEQDAAPEQPSSYQHTAGPAPTAAIIADAACAMTVAKHLKSNAICIVRDRTLFGAGAGQMDRLAACRLAVEKAGERLRSDQHIEPLGAGGDSNGGGSIGPRGSSSGPVAASDAFFPFADGPRVLIDAGVRAIVHPGGSKRDDETFALCNERGVTCLLTGRRHFRH